MGSSTDYQRKIFNGSKSLTKNIKRSFSRPFKTQELAAFFRSRIADEKVRDLMTSFAIPLSVEVNKEIMSIALSRQLKLFIENNGDDITDIVATEYQKLMVEPAAIEPTQQSVPLYPGDSAWVLECKPQRSYSVHCYDRFQHTWVIRNNGSQTWCGRKLVFANCKEVPPRADVNCIDIPDTPPSKDIKITADFDARGYEGRFDCVWEMQDIDGKNCFPNDKKKFNVTINIEFKDK